MLQVTLIGNVGAKPDVHNEQGREFITFRVAHNERWKDESGQEHNQTIWVDCIMNGKPAVTEYLQAGTTVCVVGSARLRVYSSAKDRCMKAGLTISIRSIELIGSRPDTIPSRLYDSNGVQHDVTKFYFCDITNANLMSMSGALFVTDDKGWVSKVDDARQTEQNVPAGQDVQAEQTPKSNDDTPEVF